MVEASTSTQPFMEVTNNVIFILNKICLQNILHDFIYLENLTFSCLLMFTISPRAETYKERRPPPSSLSILAYFQALR